MTRDDQTDIRYQDEAAELTRLITSFRPHNPAVGALDGHLAVDFLLAGGENKLMPDAAALQLALCREHGAAFSPPASGSRVGIALQTLGRLPLHGLRIPAHREASGWYLWAGDAPTDAPDFYQPLCVEHLAQSCPLAVRFLGLPAGWRFLTDGEDVDVWYDAGLLEHRRG